MDHPGGYDSAVWHTYVYYQFQLLQKISIDSYYSIIKKHTPQTTIYAKQNGLLGWTYVRPVFFASHPLISQTLFIKSRKKADGWTEMSKREGNNKKVELIDRQGSTGQLLMDGGIRSGHRMLLTPANVVPFPLTIPCYTCGGRAKQNTGAFYLSLRVNFMSLKVIKLHINRGAYGDIINPFLQ